MNPLLTTLNQKFDFNLSDWEKLLALELKTDQIHNKATKKYLDLGSFPTLSLDNLKSRHFYSSEIWKKASQTFLRQPTNESLDEDIQNGVKVFFLNSYSSLNLNPEIWEKYLDNECEVYCLNKAFLQGSSKFKVFNEKDLVLARNVHDMGGSSSLELAYVASELTKKLDVKEWRIGVFLGSDIFKTIGKLRAIRLIAIKIQELAKVQIPTKIIGLNSYRDWTTFERYSNILRNDAQVMAGYMGGADIVQSSGYNTIIEIESELFESEHHLRSCRLSRNTCHILALESMLGIVDDPASGSFHLEGLTQRYSEVSWNLMQELLKSTDPAKFLNEKIEEHRNYKIARIKTRKDVMAGTNDYPDVKETLNLKLSSKFYRTAFVFEELRLRLNQIKNLPQVEIHLKGSYADLSSRINFIKNYFELIGLQVIDPLDLKQTKIENIIVLCAKDEEYPDFSKTIDVSKNVDSFLAGKAEISGFKIIHAGQNVYDVLVKLVEKLEANS